MKPIFSDELLRLLQKISEHYQVSSPKRKRGQTTGFLQLVFSAFSGRGGLHQNFCRLGTLAALAI